jgi:hypothetical protein
MEQGGFDFDTKPPPPGISLREAIAEVDANKAAGIFSHCPCCDQGVKVYGRKITGVMVAQLFQMGGEGPVHPKNIKHQSLGRDWGKLCYWNLAQHNEDGNWRCTERGYFFLHDKIKVPKHAYVFNQDVLGHGDELVGVRDCMGARFDYDELMAVTTFPPDWEMT